MATGDIRWFQQGVLDLGNKIHNLSADVLRLGIVTSATVPTMATAGPHWGGTGTTNFASTQVGIAGGYTGPVALASVTWSNIAGVLTLRATDVVVPQNAVDDHTFVLIVTVWLFHLFSRLLAHHLFASVH